MDLGTVPAWVAIALSAASVVVALRAKADSRRSSLAAQESAATAARQLELSEAAAKKPPWRLEHRAGDTFLLHNDGSDELFGVELAGEVIMRPEPPQALSGGGAMQFFALNSMGVSDDAVTVTWHRLTDLADEPHQWRHPLPAKPRPAGR